MTRPVRPPWWAVLSSAAAPVLLIGGWLLAQAVVPYDVDAVRDTISSLARAGAPDRWIMTVGLAGLGVAHVVTALGLSVLAPVSRVVLALAGVATVGVAAFPEPFTGSSGAHGACASVAFVLLALWPVTTVSTRSVRVRRPVVALAVTAVSVALLVRFAVALDGPVVGLWERVLAAQQACWPLVLVVALRSAGARAGHDDRIRT